MALWNLGCASVSGLPLLIWNNPHSAAVFELVERSLEVADVLDYSFIRDFFQRKGWRGEGMFLHVFP
jgi:hypothetical protein